MRPVANGLLFISLRYQGTLICTAVRLRAARTRNLGSISIKGKHFSLLHFFSNWPCYSASILSNGHKVLFLHGYSGRSVKLTANLHLVYRLNKHIAISLLLKCLHGAMLNYAKGQLEFQVTLIKAVFLLHRFTQNYD